MFLPIQKLLEARSFFCTDKQKKIELRRFSRMVVKKIWMIILAICSLVFLFGCKKEDKIKIGITQITAHVALDSTREGFIAALKEAGFTEDKVEFIFKNAFEDLGNANLIASEFVSAKVDLIFAISTPSALAVKNVTLETDIPVLFSAVTDPVAAKLVDSLEKPGSNITGTSDMTPIDKQFALIKQLFHEATKIGFVYNLDEDNSLVQLQIAQEVAARLGLTVLDRGVTTSSELADAVDVLIPQVDVIYLPSDNLVANSVPIVVEKANNAGIPTVASERGQVENGALITDGIDYYQLGYQTGLMAVRILNGEKPSDIPVETLENTEIVINMQTARTLKLTFPQEILDVATLIEE